MCWACNEPSSYRACDGCGTLKETQELQQYDILREWGQLVEFIETKQRIVVFCANCRDAMDNYRESTRAHVGEMEPSGLYLPEPRQKASKPDAIPVAIKVEGKTLGLKCAREVYGDEAVEEILQGFLYQDNEMPERIR